MAPAQRQTQPTIGILADLIHSPTEALVLPGVVDVLTGRGANALLFIGRALDLPLASQSPANRLFDRIDARNVDGLIALSGSLANYGPERVRKLLETYRGLPVVSTWLRIEGFPSITIDNRTGMYATISHLIETHGARRIAFISGPDGHTEAAERLDSYRRALADHGLEYDPALVAEGRFVKPSGVSAIQTLLDERGVTFDALASANDEMLFGAIEVLRASGVRVPADIPAVGFDDIAPAGSFNPPLTTVRQPFYEMGRRAAETVLAMLAGQSVPDETRLPAEPIVRRSCGCALPSIEQIVPVRTARQLTPAGIDTLRADLPTDLRRTMRRAVDPVVDAVLPSGWPADLLNALAGSIDGASEPFLTQLEKHLDASIVHQGGLIGWQDVITAMRSALLPALADPDRAERLEVLLHQARTLVSMALVQAQTASTERWYTYNYYLNLCMHSLVSALDIPTQMDVLAEYLPRLDIEAGCVMLYDEPSIDAATSQVVLAFDQSGRIVLDGGKTHFPTAELLPDGLLRGPGPNVFTVQPLHFQDEHLGLLFLHVAWQAGSLYELLRTMISASVKSALLYQDLQQHSQGLEQAVAQATAELRRAKEQAETILNNSPDITLLLTPDGLVERANSACGRLLDYPPGDLDGQSPAVLLTAESRPALLKALDEVRRADGPVRLELLAGHKRGRSVDVAVVLAPVREHGELTGIVCGMHNITPLKEVERMKDALLATAAHELRTPLTTIQGFSELLLTREVSAERRARYLSLIEEQSVHLTALIDNLLDVAKIHAGRELIGQVEQIDVKNLVMQAAQPFIETSPRHVFWFGGLDSLPPVTGDAFRLAQVFRNLISNAVKYSPDGGSVSICAQTSNGVLHIAVQDEGIGMTDEEAARAFERFYRADQSNSAAEGTGLGLTISQAIAREHGGDIQVESAPGEGSTFTLTLPCDPAHQMVQ